MFIYFLILAVILYTTIGFLLYFIQNKFIFFPTHLDQDYPFNEFPNAEEIFVDIDQNTRINALYFKVPAAKGVVLYFHGNARALDDWGNQAKMFNTRGYDVLMHDYRSYGKSTGIISEENFYHDAFLMYDSLLKNWETKDIILYGRSMGCGMAVELGRKKEAQQVILETPYTSIPDVAKVKVPFYPVKHLLKVQFANHLKIKEIKCPIHIFHGTKDELIPYKQAVKLAKIYGDNGILTTIPNGTHNNLPDYELFHTKLSQLIP